MKSWGSLLTLNSNIKSSQCSSKFYLLHFLQVSKLFCEKLWAKIVFDRCNFVLRIQRFGYPVMLCLLSSTQFYLFLIYSLLYIYIVSKISYVLFFLSEFLGRAHLSCSESCIELTLICLSVWLSVGDTTKISVTGPPCPVYLPLTVAPFVSHCRVTHLIYRFYTMTRY